MSAPYPSYLRGPGTSTPNYSQTRPYGNSTPTSSTRLTSTYPMRNTPSRAQPSTPQPPPQPYTHSQTAQQPYSHQQHAPVPQTYHHPYTFAPGPLPFFLPPPGQPTRDPTLPPPVSQAMLSTYPSRLRTGVTGLVQPEHITGGPREREYLLAELDREIAAARSGSGASTPRVDSPAPYSGMSMKAKTTLSGRRTKGIVSYAEKESGDEEEEDEESDDDMSEIQEAASDPEDTDYGGGGGGGSKRRRTERDRSTTGRGYAPMGMAEQQSLAKAGKLKKRRDELDKGWTWLGDRVPGERVRSQMHKGTKHVYMSEELLEKEASRPEMLVPITVDFDVISNNPDQQGTKIKDRFLWNVNEPFITPQQFSQIFCDDIGIPAHYATTMAELIQAQLDEAQGTVEIDVVDPEVTEDDVVWSEDEVEDQTAQANGHGGVNGGPNSDSADNIDDGVAEDEEEEEQEVALEKEKEWSEADCRIVVNLDVQIYTHILRDRIEWDLSSHLAPSVFAKHYCTELGLTGEAIPLVAHAITDELLKHKRDALELELFSRTHPIEQAKWDKLPGGLPRTNNRKGAQGLIGVWRDWWEREEYGPILVELSTEEMERREQERTREARRMMRTLATSKRRR